MKISGFKIKNFKNKVNALTLFMLVLLFTSVFFFPAFRADDGQDVATSMAQYILDGGATKQINNMIGGDPNSLEYKIFNTFVKDQGQHTFWDPVNGYSISGGTFSNAVKGLTTAMQAFAGVYLAVIIISELFTSVMSGRDPIEGICQAFFQVGVGGIMIVNAPYIISLLISIGVELINSASTINSGILGSKNGSTVSAKDILDIIVGEGGYDMTLAEGKHGLDLVGAYIRMFGMQAKCICTLIVPWIGAVIATGVSFFLIIQVCIEVALRKVLVPFAIVDIYKEGIRSPGIRYMKKILVSVLKIMMIVVISKLTAGLSALLVTNLEGNVLIGLAMMVIAQFSAIGVMFKGGDYVSDALNVN